MSNKDELIYQLVNKEYVQPYFKDSVELSNYSKISISDISTLGTAFVPFIQFMADSCNASNQLMQQLGTKYVYVASDKIGNSLRLTQKVKGESDKYIGSVIKDGSTGQARFKEVSVKDLSSGQILFDPITAIMAAELIYINKEIKVVKQQQKEMF
ncbi:MAG: hypothetical protein IJU45_05530, partial [Clostridia bacterium]|nr:hypothetical protein [Clostridia bacterium]